MHWLAKMSIKQRLWMGFGAMMAITLALALTALLRMAQMEQQARQVVDDIQPLLRLSSELEGHLRDSAQHLGFFLLSKDQDQLQIYRSSLGLAEQKLAQLSEHERGGSAAAELTKLTAAIGERIQRYRSHESQMETLAASQSANFPAQAYAVEHLNPRSQQILQFVSEMLLSEEGQRVSRQRTRVLRDIAELRYNWANVMTRVRSFLAFRESALFQDVGMYRVQGDDLITKLQAYGDVLTFEQANALEQIIAVREDFFQHLDRMVEIHSGDAWRTDTHLMRTEVEPLIQEMESLIRELVDQQRAQMQQRNDTLLTGVARSKWQVMVLLLAALAVAMVVAALTTGQLGRLVKEVREGLDHLANGDLHYRMNEAAGGEQGQVATVVNGFSARLGGMVGELSHAIESLHQAAADMSQVTSHTSTGIQQQYSETEQVASAINQMSASAHEVARNALHAAGSAQAANDEASKGALLATESMGGIEQLLSQVETASAVVRELNQHTDDIGMVLDVIRNIAEQTNLLALNAAIEAARAGESGRGFAVVADEVRTLAKRTQDSTQEIQDMIERLQAGAGSAVDAMGAAREQAMKNSEQVETSAESLGGIAGSVCAINDLIAQIASASEEQGAVAEEINRNILNISQVADETAAGARQTLVRGEELENLANQLNGLIGQFRVA